MNESSAETSQTPNAASKLMTMPCSRPLTTTPASKTGEPVSPPDAWALHTPASAPPPRTRDAVRRGDSAPRVRARASVPSPPLASTSPARRARGSIPTLAPRAPVWFRFSAHEFPPRASGPFFPSPSPSPLLPRSHPSPVSSLPPPGASRPRRRGLGFASAPPDDRPAGVKTLVLAARPGAALAAELCASTLPAHDAVKTALPSAQRSGRVSRAMYPLAGAPALDRWLAALRRCRATTRAPADSTRVVVACASDAASDYDAWTAGASSNGARVVAVSSGPRVAASPAAQILDAIDAATVGGPSFTDHWLIVLDGDAAPEPNFDLDAFSATSLALGKDAVLRGDVCASEPKVELKMRAGPANQPREIARVMTTPAAAVQSGARSADPEGTSDNSSDDASYLGSACLLRRDSGLPLLREFVALDETSGEAPETSFARFLEFLRVRVAVLATPTKNCRAFSLETLRECDDARDLFAFFAEIEANVRGERPNASVAAADTTKAKSDSLRLSMLKRQFAAQDARRFGAARDATDARLAAALDLAIVMPAFESRRERSRRLDAPPALARGADLPFRFREVDAWRKSTPAQHPCYVTTSNASVGAKLPTAADMPLSWHGQNGTFTAAFGGTPYRDDGLIVAVDKSKVHRALDGIV